jgi:hypothetical protein
MPGQHIKELQKTAILGTADIVQKVKVKVKVSHDRPRWP